MFHYKNITGAPITSLTGIVIIIIALASVLTGKSDWPGACAAITLGAGFAFAKDPGTNAKTGLCLILITGFVFMACNKKVVQNHSQSESRFLSHTDTVIRHDSINERITINPASTASETLPFWALTAQDSGVLKQPETAFNDGLKVNKKHQTGPYIAPKYTLIVSTRQGNAQLSVYKGDNQTIKADCKCDSSAIIERYKERFGFKTISIKDKQTETEQNSVSKTEGNLPLKIIIGLLIVAAFVFVAKKYL